MPPSIEYRDRCPDACPQGLHKYSLVERNSDSFDHLSSARKITRERILCKSFFLCVYGSFCLCMLVSAHERDVFWQNEDYELVDLRLHLDVTNQGHWWGEIYAKKHTN